MMTSALLHAGTVLDDDWANSHALSTLASLRREGEADAVAHTPGGIGGLLDDQVQTAAAALDGYQATGDSAWLGWAEAIMDRVWRDYWDDERGGLFDVAKGREDGTGVAPARAKPVQDTPTPSPNGVAGIVAARLHELTGSPRWRERGSALVAAFAGRASELGLYAATYLLALDWQVNPANSSRHRRSPGRRDRGRDAPARAGCLRAPQGGPAGHDGGAPTRVLCPPLLRACCPRPGTARAATSAPAASAAGLPSRWTSGARCRTRGC